MRRVRGKSRENPLFGADLQPAQPPTCPKPASHGPSHFHFQGPCSCTPGRWGGGLGGRDVASSPGPWEDPGIRATTGLRCQALGNARQAWPGPTEGWAPFLAPVCRVGGTAPWDMGCSVAGPAAQRHPRPSPAPGGLRRVGGASELSCAPTTSEAAWGMKGAQHFVSQTP